MCTIEDFLPKEFSVKWKNNANYITGSTNWAPQLIGDIYSAISVLTVKNTDWDSNAVYMCEVKHRETTYTKKVSKGTGLLQLYIILLYCNSESAVSDMIVRRR